ncbi:MAG: ParB-like nuclease domain-containing protein [Anaerolineae bacterium]|nr:ParB-like nuclease domain-containing protein [Anaerolineae bacterium]
MTGDLLEYHNHYGPQASDLYERVWWRGVLARLLASLLGQPYMLALLSDRYPDSVVLSKHAAVYRAIRLEHIIGTAGSLGFDANFRPLTRKDRERLISVAIGMLADPSSLPPIHVVEVAGDYYVVDGHHRVSVAKALKRLYLDAEVVSNGHTPSGTA